MLNYECRVVLFLIPCCCWILTPFPYLEQPNNILLSLDNTTLYFNIPTRYRCNILLCYILLWLSYNFLSWNINHRAFYVLNNIKSNTILEDCILILNGSRVRLYINHCHPWSLRFLILFTVLETLTRYIRKQNHCYLWLNLKTDSWLLNIYI